MFVYRIYHVNGGSVLSLGYTLTNACMAFISYLLEPVTRTFGSWNYLYYGLGLMGIVASLIVLILPTPQPPRVLNDQSKHVSPQLTSIKASINSSTAKVVHVITSRQGSTTPRGNKANAIMSYEEQSHATSVRDVAVETLIQNNEIPITSTTEMGASTLVGTQIDISVPKTVLKPGHSLSHRSSKVIDKIDETLLSKDPGLAGATSDLINNINTNMDQSKVDKYHRIIFIVSLILNFAWYGLFVGYTSYIAIWALYGLKTSEAESLTILGVYLNGWFLGKFVVVFLLKCFEPHNVHLLFQTLTLIMGLLVLYFYDIKMLDSRKLLYPLLFFDGLFGSPIFILTTAFLNRIKPITGFVTSMLLTACCAGAGTAGWLFGFVCDYTGNYSYILYLIIIISVIDEILAIVIHILFLILKYVAK